MTRRPSGRLLALTAHARDVAAPERDRFATALRAALPADALLLATCHRIEAYAMTDTAILPDDARPIGAQCLEGDDAARHLIAVAVGRDSVVLGEDEILHQLRASHASARDAGSLDATVDRLVMVALQAGRRARSWQQGRRRSLGDVAIEAIDRGRGAAETRHVIVVGAGRMGGLAARAAARTGARVTVANRSSERARDLADAIGGQVADLDPGPVVADATGVIVALAAPWRPGHRTVDRLIAGDAVVVDLSFPSAVAGTLAARLGDRLVTGDALALGGSPVRARAGSPDRRLGARLDDLVDRAVASFATWHARGDGRAAAAALIEMADRERAAELDALWRRLPGADPETRDAIDAMSRRLAARLLRPPLERLGRDTEGREGSLIRELYAL